MRRRETELTPQEQNHVRAALRVLKVRDGGLDVLAARMEVTGDHLRKALSGQRSIGAMTAIRVAEAAGAALEDILTGRYPGPTACRHCGHPFDDTTNDEEIPDVQ